MLKEKIKQLSSEYLEEIIAVRRHLHAHPELSFEEHNTSKFICQKLDEYKIPYTKGIVKTGIVALIEGKNAAKKCIALRADIDALPIQETNKVSYCSINNGVMHACGHDVHTASLLGAAKILSELKTEFEGTIKLIFQPGEEKLPGGASLMIKEGVLNNPKVNSIYGQHVFPSLTAGKVGFRKGMYMASTDEIYLKIIGKGGHAAMPNTYNSPLLVSSKILLALNNYFMEEKLKQTPNIPTVLAFGNIIGKGATNVIPDEVNIEGTFRTFDEKWRKEAHQIIKSISETIAIENNAKCEVKIESGYPFLTNDEILTQNAITKAQEFLGNENVIDLDLRMTAEDFSYYTQQIQGCFYRLGTASTNGENAQNVHTSNFNIDENALKTGMGLMAWLAINPIQ
ncbi:MAG: M20 family metallopeptidase [Bacteroidota bacterium]